MRTCVLALLLLALTMSLASARVIAVAGFNNNEVQLAVRSARPGDEVRFWPGTYTLTDPIVPKPGMILRGAGEGSTILQFAGNKAGAVMIAIVGVEQVLVSDLTLDGADSPFVQQGIYGYNSRFLTIRHVTICNFARSDGPHAIHFSGDNPTRLHGVTDSLIEHCTIENMAPGHAWGAGIRCSWGSSRIRILDNRITNTGRGGIFGDNGSTELVILRNTVTESHGEKLGIEVWGGCDHSVIEDNHIDHWLSIGGSDWCATRRNTIGCPDGDFGFIGIEAIGSYLVFSDNVVDDGQVIGLSVSNVSDKRYHFYRNESYLHCSQWAAQLQGDRTGCRDYYFQNCKFDGTTVGSGKVIYPGDDGNGFRINGNCRGFVLEDCDISSNGRNGIQITTKGGGDFLSFIGCHLTGNKGAAIIHGGGFTGLEWRDCTVTGNASNDLPPAVPMPAPPVAGLTGPAQARVGETVQFRSTAQAGGGEVQKIMWDLGDGIPATGTSVRHRFSKTGTYTVTQIVWDANDRADRASAKIEILP